MTDRFDGEMPTSATVVVIGAGSAGCTVARRLVDAGVDVLLLEAGPADEHPAIHDPLRMFELWAGEGGLDWGYESVPQEHIGGRRIPQTRGRVLGGCSSVNGMYHVRGLRCDYDTWAYLGNAGWRYEDLLPLFRRSESYDGGGDAERGGDGPLSVVSDYEPHPLLGAMMAAAEAAGHRRNPDYNRGDHEGVALIQLDAKDGERHNAARAFIHPVADNPNLTVRTGCQVRRLLFDGDRCSGVEVEREGRTERVEATAEVVLSAGVFDSPKLLMLSGVGPAAELGAHGIESVAELPGVGRNLHDHVFSPLVYSARTELPQPPEGIPAYHVHMFFRSRAGLPGPDMQSLFGPMPHYPDGYEGPEEGFTFTSMLNRPASRGTVTLASADPAAAPLIDPEYGACVADLEAIASGIEQLREVAAQSALDRWRDVEVVPGEEVRTRAQLLEFVRETLGTIYHPVGTCRMGIDALAVVDPKLRVNGVTGLRVADASVMPMATSGNTHVPSVTIAERCADEVRAALGVEANVAEVVA